jgi:hypothetical protein
MLSEPSLFCHKKAYISELTFLSEKYQIPFLGYNQNKCQLRLRRSKEGGVTLVSVAVRNLEIAIKFCRSICSQVQN